MPVSIKGTGGGGVTLDAGAAASDTTLTLPNTTGTVALTASPTFSGTVTATTITSPAATALTVQSAGSTAMTVDTSQNVGIGTTSPGRKVDIEQSSTDYQLRIGDNGGNYYDIGRNTGNGLLTFNGNQAVASGYVFSTVNGERMRIDTSGNLLVGTTSSYISGSSAKSQIAYTKQTQWAFFIRPTDNNTGGGGPVLFQNLAGTTIGTISADASNVAYNTSSDYRLKHSVAPLIGGLATLSALNPVTYKWIIDDKPGEGFLAHELQAIIPLAVAGEKDAVDDEGNIKPQGVDYSKIVVHLVAAIQEQQAQIEELKARLSKGGL